MLPFHSVPEEESEDPMSSSPKNPSNVGETMIEAIYATLKKGARLKVQLSIMREPVLVEGITFVGNDEIILIPEEGVR